ncbi:hypothetical protein GQ457_17G009980 [Hibiscus cannabinus]
MLSHFGGYPYFSFAGVGSSSGIGTSHGSLPIPGENSTGHISSTTPVSFASSSAQSSATRDNSWYPDSGATHHITHACENLQSGGVYTGKNRLHMGNGAGVHISHIGQGSLYTCSKPLHLQNLLYVPSIQKNLLSVSQLVKDNDVSFEFFANGCCIKDARNQNVLLEGKLTHEGLYQLSPPSVHTINSAQLSPPNVHTINSAASYNISKPASVLDLELWHKRLGHPSDGVLKTVLKSCNVVVNENKVSHMCSACLQGKAHKLPFSRSSTEYKEPFDLVVSDLWGPAPLNSDGFVYYVSFIDVYSRHTWLYLLKQKSEVVTCFINFYKLVEVQFGYKIKAL